MLRFLRERGSSIILKGVLAFVALTFISWGGFTLSQGPSVSGGRVAVWVNETPVTVLEFERRYQLQAEALRRQLGAAFNEEMAQQLGLRQQIMSGLVMEKLQLEEARRLNLWASDVEVALRIQELPYFQRGGRFDRDLYNRLLVANRTTPPQFEEEQRRLLILDRLQRYVGMGASVSEQEVRNLYRWLNQRASVEAIVLPPSRFAKEVVFGEDDLKKYFEKRKESYRVGPQRKAEWWYLPYEAVAGRVAVSESDLKTRYEETKSKYVLKERVSVNQILLKLPPDADAAAVEKARREIAALSERIRRGESFEAVAKKHSEGPAAPKGGDLGTFSRGEMLPDIEKVAFSLKEGEISGPVRTSFGVHLIRVRDRQAARRRPLEEVRAQVEEDVRRLKARAVARRELRRVRYGVEDKKPVSDPAGLRRGTTGFFEQGTPPASVPEGALLADLVFDIAKKGGLSKGKEGEHGILFARLIDMRGSRLPPFEEVKEKVRGAYLEEKGAEVAKRRAEGWRQELEGGKKTFAALAKELGLGVIAPEPFTRAKVPAELGGGAEVVRAAFGLAKGKFTNVPSGRNVIMLRGLGAPAVDMSKFEAERKDLERRLLQEKRSLLFLRHMEGVRQAAKVRLEAGFAL